MEFEIALPIGNRIFLFIVKSWDIDKLNLQTFKINLYIDRVDILSAYPDEKLNILAGEHANEIARIVNLVNSSSITVEPHSHDNFGNIQEYKVIDRTEVQKDIIQKALYLV